MSETTIGPSSMPNSNPLGNTFETGTTDATMGKVTTGGQNANVKQQEKIAGTLDVAENYKDEMGLTSTGKVKANAMVSYSPDGPYVPPPRDFKPSNVQVNEWLTSFFMTALSVNFTKIAMLAKDIHKAEGINIVMQLARIWSSAQMTAELILAKAQKEAAMHMALAISAVVGIAVAVAGTALSISGNLKSAAAKLRKEKLESGAPNTPTSQQAAAGANPIAPSQGAKPNAAKAVSNDPNNPAVNQVSAAPNQSKAPKAVGDKQPDTPITEREKILQDKTKGKIWSALGAGVTQMANPINQFMENLIQMVFKPEIASYDAKIELMRALKDMISKALDSAIQSMNAATEELNSTISAKQKADDETIRANSINSRG